MDVIGDAEAVVGGGVKLLSGWQGYALAAALSAALAGSAAVWATATIYGATISDLKREKADTANAAAQASLTRFEAASANITAAADGYVADKNALNIMFTKIHKDFANAIFKKPLPVGCKPDAERLRQLGLAVDAANSDPAAGHVP